jgi:hypothetical protein
MVKLGKSMNSDQISSTKLSLSCPKIQNHTREANFIGQAGIDFCQALLTLVL